MRKSTHALTATRAEVDTKTSSSSAEFHSRTVFTYDAARWPREKVRPEARGCVRVSYADAAQMEADFQQLAAELGATRSTLRVPQLDARRRMGILVSQFDQCLTELLHRWEGGELDVDLTCVIRRVAPGAGPGAPALNCGNPCFCFITRICVSCVQRWAHTRSALRSNHQRERNTYVSRFLERHGVPLYYVPAGRVVPQGQMRSHEPAMLSLVHRSDFLVLARYMQVLSGAFLNAYGRDIINIHHGLLPSFKGANPYRQAYAAGVKVIGATSHFVTEELDGGPIIEQMVERVSHRDSLSIFAEKSRTLEKNCLFTAARLYVDERVVRCEGGSRVAVLQ